jgi:hypothetical protein
MSLIGPPEDPTMRAAMEIAYLMYRDLAEANVSAWIYCFTIFNPNFPGSMGLLSPVDGGRLVIPKRFWAFSNFSRFVRPGWRRMEIEGLGFATVGFLSPEADRFAIVALNGLPSARPATYRFGEWEVVSVETYRTSPEQDLASVGGVKMSPNEFEATLAPVSVTTFTGRLRQPQQR